MDLLSLEQRLADLPLGGLRYFDRIDSTNLEAARWVDEEAVDLALVVADEQTAGRGRKGRKWITPSGAALAFSLVIRETALISRESNLQRGGLVRLTALGALAVCLTLKEEYGLPARIKWPNDVLVGGEKLAGVLVETHWYGERLAAAILGVGVNVSPQSVPKNGATSFPATCVESALGAPVQRMAILRAVLGRILSWRRRLFDPAFILTWEENLTWRGEWVQITGENEKSTAQFQLGKIIGLDQQGHLVLCDPNGETFSVKRGGVRQV